MNKKRKLSLVALCIFIVGLVATVASAAPSQEVWTYYYSDSSYITLVGVKLNTTCYGAVNAMVWGTTSSRWVKLSEPGSCGSSASSTAMCFLNGWQTTCPSYLCDTLLVDSCE